MTIGYDSDEAKQSYLEDVPHIINLGNMILMAACMQEATCAVCNKQLYPLFMDPDHHANFSQEWGEDVIHFCGQHCPACNGKERNGY